MEIICSLTPNEKIVLKILLSHLIGNKPKLRKASLRETTDENKKTTDWINCAYATPKIPYCGTRRNVSTRRSTLENMYMVLRTKFFWKPSRHERKTLLTALMSKEARENGTSDIAAERCDGSITALSQKGAIM
ncbi:MAG: hypothetical protein EOP04_31955 [Proteobacteria bacterium]|nr:MAG: hypothetical protein EOP04_31955 [Pseudomonadota bacterium]